MNNIETGRTGFFPSSKTGKSPLSKTGIQKNTPERVKELNAFAKSDSKVDISDGIKDFAKIKKVVDATPEKDNSEKIAKLRAQIEAGTYQVNYDALADKILSEEF